ncbi:MAG: hypothetical protein NUV78_00065 [Candidatus Zambryskibacteria bacterium]|nr:hypothetical protein [Candidatus Zambryskibacteria bacterium]
MNRYRIPLTILIFLAILFLPYWIYVPLLFAGVLVLPFFWEGIFFGLLIDTLYAESGLLVSTIIYSFAFWATLILVMMIPVRKRLRTYA